MLPWSALPRTVARRSYHSACQGGNLIYWYLIIYIWCLLFDTLVFDTWYWILILLPGAHTTQLASRAIWFTLILWSMIAANLVEPILIHCSEFWLCEPLWTWMHLYIYIRTCVNKDNMFHEWSFSTIQLLSWSQYYLLWETF